MSILMIFRKNVTWGLVLVKPTEELRTGQVNVLWPDITSGGRSSLPAAAFAAAATDVSQLTLHKMEMDKKRESAHQYSWNSQTKFSSTFSFCRFFQRAGRLASGRTCFCLSFLFHRLSQRSGLVVWSGGRRTGVRSALRGLRRHSCSAMANTGYGASATLTSLIK